MTRVGTQIFATIYPHLAQIVEPLGFLDKDYRNKILEVVSIEDCIRHITNLIASFAWIMDAKTVFFESFRKTEDDATRLTFSDIIEISVSSPVNTDSVKLKASNFDGEMLFDDIAEFLRRVRTAQDKETQDQ
jgi:hypothetical protein